ncbi:MAG TPA: hypothetical protein VFM88_09990 [Vicinamibacteria bacterium]|nr:hypothetical protein [Vicinamibacteria bacterium]
MSETKAGLGERIAVAAAAAVFLELVFFRDGVLIYPFRSGSNGVFLDQAQRVLDGQVMYRDFFEFVGPGMTHLNALILLVVGRDVGAYGHAMVALGAALAVLMHGLSCLVAGRDWRLLPPALFLALVYAPYTFGDHKWPALAFGLAGLGALGRRPLSAARAIRGGLLLGMAGVFTQDLGIGLAAGAVWAHLAARRPLRLVMLLALACLVPLAGALAFFASKAGLQTVVYDFFVYPFERYPAMNLGLVERTLPLRTLARELAQLGLAAGGVIGAVAVLRRPEATAAPQPSPGRLVAWAGLGMLVPTGYRGLFPLGLAVLTAVLIPLLVALLERRWRKGRAGLGERGLALLLAAGVLHGSVGLVVWRQFFGALVLEEHRAGRIWVSRPLPELTWIESQTVPGEPALLLPAKGGQYFLSRTRDVTSFPYLIEGQNTLEQARRALHEIEAAPPAVGVWDQRPWLRTAPDTEGPLAELYRGIRRSYDAEPLPSGVLLLRRKAEVPGTPR